MQAQSASIDPADVERFERLGASWWNPRGPMRPLHQINPLRLRFVEAQIASLAVAADQPPVIAIGSIMLPAMVKQGFPKRFGAGVITTSGALGILIPPSIVMLMYAISTNTSG